MTAADAARKYKTSQTSVAKWRGQFLEPGKTGLAAVGSRCSSGWEERLEAEIEELKTALGKALSGLPLIFILATLAKQLSRNAPRDRFCAMPELAEPIRRRRDCHRPHPHQPPHGTLSPTAPGPLTSIFHDGPSASSADRFGCSGWWWPC
ncbi:hypothetical protein [Streptomyces sp. NPDC007205]|uniref:hypothetical protein n=1 Tax=Streptomyces sp. NPDC007205 TaxID=3154316 RepID=UPI0033F537D5